MKTPGKVFFLLTVLVSLIFSGTITAIASAAASNVEIRTKLTKPVTIEFWHALTGDNEDALQEIVYDFNTKNENINVSLVYQGHYRELFQKLSGAAQAGQLPELTMIYPNRMTAYIMNDLGQDLTPYMTNEEVGFSKEELIDIPAVFMKGMWDNKYYTLPCNKSVYELIYNEDMFKEKDVTVPKTWEELRAAAKQLTVDTNGDGENEVVGLALNRSAGIDFSFWVEQAGGHLLSEDESTLLFNSPAGVEAFDFIKGMVDDNILNIVTEDKYAYVPFSRKEAGMIITSTSKIPDLKNAIGNVNLNWNAAVLPAHKKDAVLFTGTDMAMFNTHTEEEKLASWLFMKYFMSKDATVKWGVKSGYLPVRYSALESPEFKAFILENPTKAIAVQSFTNGFRDPKILNGYAIHSNMQKALEMVIHRKKTSKEALADAEKQARKELDEAMNNFGK